MAREHVHEILRAQPGQAARCTELQPGIRLSAFQVAQTTRQMGLEALWQASRRTLRPLPASERHCAKHSSTPSLSRPDGARDFSQLYGQFWRSVPHISERRICVREGARSLRGELQLLTVSTRKVTLGDPYEKNDYSVMAGACSRGLRIGGNQVHRHQNFRDGLRGLCTRRARVIEIGIWCGLC